MARQSHSPREAVEGARLHSVDLVVVERQLRHLKNVSWFQFSTSRE